MQTLEQVLEQSSPIDGNPQSTTTNGNNKANQQRPANSEDIYRQQYNPVIP